MGEKIQSHIGEGIEGKQLSESNYGKEGWSLAKPIWTWLPVPAMGPEPMLSFLGRRDSSEGQAMN